MNFKALYECGHLLSLGKWPVGWGSLWSTQPWRPRVPKGRYRSKLHVCVLCTIAFMCPGLGSVIWAV